MTEHKTKYKILLIGDSTVGKTCFILRFCDGTFTEFHISTIGVDNKTKFVKYNDKEIVLEIWDSAGQERFKCITVNYIKGADGILLLYDITQRESFKSLKTWMNAIKDKINSNDVSIIIVGNKCDLNNIRKVEEEEGKEYSAKGNWHFFEASGKTGDNVEEVFSKLVDLMEKRTPKDKDKEKSHRSTTIIKNSKKDKEKKDCCNK